MPSNSQDIHSSSLMIILQEVEKCALLQYTQVVGFLFDWFVIHWDIRTMGSSMKGGCQSFIIRMPKVSIMEVGFEYLKIFLMRASIVHSKLLCSLARFFLISLGNLLRIEGVRSEPYVSGDLPNEDSPLM